MLQHAYGVGPSVKWGGSNAPLYKAVSSASNEAAVGCINISYTDAGLFGFFISGSAVTAGRVRMILIRNPRRNWDSRKLTRGFLKCVFQAVEAAYKVLKSGNVSEADVKRGKSQVKSNILKQLENSGSVVEDLAVQSLSGGSPPVLVPGPVLAEAIDKITVSEVAAAAKKISNGKFSLAGFGNLSNVPFLDQLK